MAKYTIEFGKLVKSGFPVFDGTWSTFVPEHKKELCDKIVRFYFFHEIGQETPERFAYYLNEQLARQMPMFNKLYESELWELFPLANQILETSADDNVTSSYINDAITRHDTAALRQFGESLYRELDSDKWSKFDETDHTVTNATTNLVGHHDETEKIDTQGTKDYTKVQDNELNETANREINTTEHSTEVMDDDTTAKTDETESKNTTSSHWSSDTPQGQIVSGGLSIDARYLTTYSHDTENWSRNLHRDEAGTDDRTTNFDKTVNTTDDLTRKVTEDNKETYDEDTTSHSDRDKDNDDVEDTKSWQDVLGTKDATTHDTYHEQGDEFKQQDEMNNGTSTAANSESGKSETGTKRTVKTTGNIGISRTQLLNQYRESIINVDEIIIRALAENFMGVF